MKRRLVIIAILIVPMFIYMIHNFIIDKNERDLYDNSKWKYIYEHKSDYPESLIELAKRNEETIAFVYEYKDRKELSMNIEENLEDGIPLLLQWDQRWGYEKYGNDYIAVNGCGPTCLSMVASYLRQDSSLNPYFISKFAYKKGYLSDVGTSWELMTDGARELGLNVRKISLNENRIIECLMERKPIICSMSKGIFTSTGHFIVLREYKDGKIFVNDPNSIIKSGIGYDFHEIKNQIKNLWCYY